MRIGAKWGDPDEFDDQPYDWATQGSFLESDSAFYVSLAILVVAVGAGFVWAWVGGLL